MIFDAHADILTDLYESHLKGDKDRFRNKHYPLYKESGITHSIFVNWTDPYQSTKIDFDQTFEIAIEQLKKNADIVRICYNYQDLLNANIEGKLGVFLGVEGVKFLEHPEDMITLYQQGIRHASLTWNEENTYATGVSDIQGGLKEKGKRLIEIMQELGMIIDLSHANSNTFNDVMDHTVGPIIVSHGNAKALCDHRRNYSDEQLFKIKERKGVIGVCAVPYFVSSDLENQTVAHLAKHIDYIVHLIGIDYVGLGLDVFYYLTEGKTSTGLKGLETIIQLNHLFDELKKLGYVQTDIDKIAYLNFNRILETVLK